MDAKRAKGFSIDPVYIESLLQASSRLVERSKRAQESAQSSSQRWNQVKDQSDALNREIFGPNLKQK